MYFRTALFAVFVAACSSTTPPTQAPAQGNSATARSTAADKPDTNKLVAHLEQHVKYPASRDDVLAACAATPEFTEAEKQWTADHLPDGDYQNAEDTVRALGI